MLHLWQNVVISKGDTTMTCVASETLFWASWRCVSSLSSCFSLLFYNLTSPWNGLRSFFPETDSRLLRATAPWTGQKQNLAGLHGHYLAAVSPAVEQGLCLKTTGFCTDVIVHSPELNLNMNLKTADWLFLAAFSNMQVFTVVLILHCFGDLP